MITAITSIIVFGMLFFAYKILIGNSRQFGLNRLILLSIPILAILATQLDFSFFSVPSNSTYLLPEVKANVSHEISSVENEHINIIQTIYWTGVFIFAALFVFKLLKTVREDSTSIAGFSFLNKFYVNDSLSDDTKEAIVSHEKLHADKLHSVDILVLELIKVVFWFNPLYSFFMKTVRLNHEFEADHYAAKTHENYSKILVSQQFNVDYALLGHSFSKSNLKQRLIMIENQKKSIRLRHYLLFVCLAGASVTANAWIPEVSNQIKTETTATSADDKANGPKFKGGMDALIKFMSEEIKYPKTAEKSGTEGKVLVAFVVAKDGSVKDVSVKQGSGNAELDKEAVRAVKAMPKWTPATKDGKAVAAEMVLPVVFKLPEEK